MKRSLFGGVVGPGARAEPERRCRSPVGSPRRRRPHAEQHRDRAEQLLAVRRRVRRRVRQHRRRDSNCPGRSSRLPAGQHPRARLHRPLAPARRARRGSARVASGPTSVASSIGSPTLQRRHPLPRTAARTRRAIASVHDEPLGGDARLAVVDGPRLDRRLRPRAPGPRSASR